MEEKATVNDWNICGHEKVVSFLESSIKNESVSNAYIFTGLSNLGKTTVAEKFAVSLLCRDVKGSKSCGICSECNQFKNKVHPDVYRLHRINNEKTGKLNRNIAIEQVRELKGKLQQATLLGGYKVAIIDGAENLNANGSNALLKILEEPSKNTLIIMIVKNVHRLLPTIISRCQVLSFLPVSAKKIEECLGAGDNNHLIAKLAHGRPGLAISFFNNPELLSQYQARIQQFLQLASGGINERLDLVGELIDWGPDESLNIKNLNELFEDWQLVVRDLILTQSDNKPFISSIGLLESLEKVSLKISFTRLKNFLMQIKDTKVMLRSNVGSKMLIENLIINL